MDSFIILNDELYDLKVNHKGFNNVARIALGAAMSKSIRRNLDFSGIARRVLMVDEIPEGVLPILKKYI